MPKKYMNRELLDEQAGFRKGRGTRDQIASIRWIIKKSKRFPERNLLDDYVKPFTVWITQTGKFLKNTRTPYLPPENLYAAQ